MAYTFSLATVLRLREIAQQREERLLNQISQQTSQTRQTLADLDVYRAELIQSREANLHRLTSAAELQLYCQMIVDVDGKLMKLREQLAKLETLRLQQVMVYKASHRDKELLEGMQQDQLQLYRREQDKREQNIMDDNFISRRLGR